MSEVATKKIIPAVVIDGPLAEPAAPVERSMGGCNTVYHACEVYHGRSNYAVCLHTIACVEQKRMQLRSECEGAIQAGTCPALKMRAEERAAGVSIYFFDRADQIRENEERARRMEGSFAYGKARRLNSLSSIQEAVQPARSGDKSSAVVSSRRDDALDADLIGRNLAGEAINRTINEGINQ